jgi:AcrR family transcriptional regulator
LAQLIERRGKPSPTEPGPEAAHRRVVALARRFFFAHGFRRVTMDDLAADLGMSKKTVYAQFASKAALLDAVMADKFAEVEADLGRATARCAGDFLGALRDLLAVMQRHTEEIRPPFVRDVRRSAPDLFRRIETRRGDLLRRHFGKLFAAGRRAGRVRADVPTRVVIEILLGATQAIMNPARIADLGLTPETGFRWITTVVLEGVLVRERGANP